MLYSLIIPVYNRPDEVDELLESLSKLDYKEDFEIVLYNSSSEINILEQNGPFVLIVVCNK